MRKHAPLFLVVGMTLWAGDATRAQIDDSVPATIAKRELNVEIGVLVPDYSSTAAQASPAAGQASGQSESSSKTGRLSDEQRAYIGRNVRVHLTDGTTAKGRLIGGTEQGLIIQPSPSDEPELIPYERVQSIAVGMQRWKKIAIGAAVAGVAALAAAVN
jgi:hypothetical protein